MMGWSLGPATGKLIEEIISNKKLSLNLTPYSIDRFNLTYCSYLFFMAQPTATVVVTCGVLPTIKASTASSTYFIFADLAS